MLCTTTCCRRSHVSCAVHVTRVCCLALGPTDERSDRIAEALSASSDAIGLAVSGRSDTTTAARQSRVFATLAGRDSTHPEDFGRRLMQGGTWTATAAEPVNQCMPAATRARSRVLTVQHFQYI